jgi:hypothetical protein
LARVGLVYSQQTAQYYGGERAQHRELILNYFLGQKLLSSGVVEGLDNKAKLTIRRSYGVSHLLCARTRPLSFTWQTAGTRINPDFF